MSKASFDKLSTAIKTSGLHAEPIYAALDAHLGAGKLPSGGLAKLAFELGAQTKDKSGDITDPEKLLAGITKRTNNPVFTDALRNRM